jgi:ribosomal protein S18 acetylase RimI-like enzyme
MKANDMDSTVYVCAATPNDSGLISRILERSIKVGCALDHRNQPALVQAWASNAREQRVSAWLADSNLHLRLGLLHDKPVGVAMARRDGRILLCYVQPEFFRRGVGRALMAEVEGLLASQQHSLTRLHSTRTAQGFYSRLGYQPCAEEVVINGLPLLAMAKVLPATAP